MRSASSFMPSQIESFCNSVDEAMREVASGDRTINPKQDANWLRGLVEGGDYATIQQLLEGIKDKGFPTYTVPVYASRSPQRGDLHRPRIIGGHGKLLLGIEGQGGMVEVIAFHCSQTFVGYRFALITEETQGLRWLDERESMPRKTSKTDCDHESQVSPEIKNVLAQSKSIGENCLVCHGPNRAHPIMDGYPIWAGMPGLSPNLRYMDSEEPVSNVEAQLFKKWNTSIFASEGNRYRVVPNLELNFDTSRTFHPVALLSDSIHIVNVYRIAFELSQWVLEHPNTMSHLEALLLQPGDFDYAGMLFGDDTMLMSPFSDLLTAMGLTVEDLRKEKKRYEAEIQEALGKKIARVASSLHAIERLDDPNVLERRLSYSNRTNFELQVVRVWSYWSLLTQSEPELSRNWSLGFCPRVEKADSRKPCPMESVIGQLSASQVASHVFQGMHPLLTNVSRPR